MNARTKSKLMRAACAAAAGSPLLLAGAATADINGPYSLDGNTAFLFHLDEAAGATLAANTQTVFNSAIAWNQPTNNVAGTTSTAILGQTGAASFGNAATFSGNLMLGYDGDNDGNYSPDLILTPAAPPNSPDGVSSTIFTDVGGSGAFTLEALVRFAGASISGGGNREIVSFDANYNNGAGTGATASRGFQFRVNNGGQLEYNSIGDGDGGIVAAIPTTGTNAYAANEWFHAAMSYDGTAGANSVRLYWTRLDAANLQANLIGTGAEGDLPTANNMLVLGNENRNQAGEPLIGLLDEVRISNVARASNQMMFFGAILNYWNNAGGGDWDAAGNWTISVPNAPAAVAIIGGGPTATTADSVITLNGTKTLGSLTFDNAAFKYTLASGTAGALSLNNGAAVPAAVTALSGSHEIAVPVTIAAAGVNITTASTATLTVSGNMTGAGGVSKAGSGTLILTGANSYGGATTVSDGTLRATDGASLPSTSNLVLSGGVLETGANFQRAGGTAAGEVQIPGGVSGFSANGADIQVAVGTIASTTALQWGAATFNPSTLILNAGTATNALSFLNPIDLNAAVRTVAVNANFVTMSGNITDSGSGGGLTKTGAGTLVLTGSNTYGGTTLVSGGVLRAAGSALSANTNLSLNGGLFEGSGAFTRTLGVGAGEVQLPGGNSGFSANGGDLTVSIGNGGAPLLWGSAAFNPAVLTINTAASTNNVNVTNDIDTNGAARTIQVNSGLSTFSGVISGTGSLSVNPVAAPGILVLTNTNTYTGGTILNNSPGIPTRGLGIVRAAANGALGTGTIDLGPQGNETQARLELIGGVTLANVIALRGRNNASDAIRNVGGSNTLSGQVQVNTGGSNYWIQSDAGTLTLSGADTAAGGVAITSVAGGTRNVTLRGAGDGVVSGEIQNGAATLNLAKDGAGTWTLSGATPYSGTTTVAAGTLRLSTNHVTSTGVSVTGGTLQLTPLTTRVLRTTTVAVAGGKLDLTDNKLITTDAPGSATGGVYSGVQGLVQTGLNGGTWDGNGIITSRPDALNNLTTIGVATGAQALALGPTDTAVWAGQTVNGSSTLVMYTYAGDLNLDGQINADDYASIDFNSGVSGAEGYYNGDINYDGAINADDYAAIDFNNNAQGAPFPTSDPVGLSVTAVPEPAACGFAGLAAFLFTRRRRRRG